jgi:hypothetical protein
MTGLFVVADTLPPAGAPVSVDVYLPTDVIGKVVELRGEGKVVRVEGTGQAESGFAAEVMFQTQHSSDVAGLGPHETQ